MRSILPLFLLAVSLQSLAQGNTTLSSADSLLNSVNQTVARDTTKSLLKTLAQTFGFKAYLPSEKPKVAFVRSLILAGWGQYTNRDYWKMGLVYGAAGAGWYFGIHNNNIKYKRYLGHYEKATLLNRGMVFYDETNLTAANALPQSSQFYISDDATNGTFYLKDATAGSQYTLEKKRGLINEQETDYFIVHNSEDTNVIGAFNLNTFKAAKDQFRRWRDASVIGFAAGWLFFALEANVSAHLKTFDMSEDISFKIEPAGPESLGMHASGIKLALTFK